MRVLTLLAGAAAIALAFFLWLASAPEDDERLLADPGGPLELVVTSVNSARRSALRNAGLVARIVNSLPPATQVLVLTNDRAAFEARGATRGRVRFVELPADNPITIWPQDPFLVLRDGGKARLLASRRFERAGDAAMASAIGDALDWPVEVSSLIFEGGNILADESRAYVGENTIHVNAAELDVGAIEVVQRFEQELGRPVTVIGPAPQPVAHIDMMLTPLGDDTIVLADSSAGADIAEDALDREPAAVAAFETDVERSFFGHPDIRELHGPDGQVIEPPRMSGVTAEAIKASRVLGNYLDELAAALRERGLRVHRVPYLQGPQSEPPESGLKERPYRQVLRYPVLTYNNVLLENRDGRPTVYLPQYGFAAVDRAARAAWASLGHHVVPVGGFSTSALYGGALRCSVKVLRRE